MTNDEPSRRLPALGRYLTLFAIAAVVVVISLPRLREFALRENEADARALLARLGAALESRAAERPLAVADLLAAGTVSPDAADGESALGSIDGSVHPRGLADAEFLEGGRLLRRHGYLFDVAAGPDQRAAVRAWPWRAGRTGQRAFVDPRGTPPLAHANPEARFSGLDGAPALESLGPDAGWTALGANE